MKTKLQSTTILSKCFATYSHGNHPNIRIIKGDVLDIDNLKKGSKDAQLLAKYFVGVAGIGNS